MPEFQSTHPVWDATEALLCDAVTAHISIHASRVGCDSFPLRFTASVNYFNPRIPCGMRQLDTATSIFQSNFNPRIPCGMRLIPSVHVIMSIISIHASRVGCDFRQAPCFLHCINISIHASRVGCDAVLSRFLIFLDNFGSPQISVIT